MQVVLALAGDCRGRDLKTGQPLLCLLHGLATHASSHCAIFPREKGSAMGRSSYVQESEWWITDTRCIARRLGLCSGRFGAVFVAWLFVVVRWDLQHW